VKLTGSPLRRLAGFFSGTSETARQRNQCTLLAVLLLCVMYGLIVYEAMNYGFWRHDDIRYLHRFDHKFLQEGRWLNYVFFDGLSRTDPKIWWAVNFVLMACFLWFLVCRYSEDRLSRVLLLGTLLAAPGLYALMNWPGVMVLLSLLLVLSTLVVDRVPYPVFLLVFSILSFGINSLAIYFLPMFYLHKRFDNWRSGLIWWSQFVLWWGLSFVVGYGIANLLVWLKFGKTIELAVWRQPHPASSFDQLLENAIRNARLFANHVSDFFPFFEFLVAGAAVFLTIAFMRRTPRASWSGLCIFVAMGFAMAIAHYVITLKHGISISHRTVFSVYWGGVLAFWGLTFLGWRPLICILMFGCIGLPAWYASYSHVAWFSQTTRGIAATVREAMPAPLHTYKRVIVDGRDFEGFYARQTEALPKKAGIVFERFDEDYRWTAALSEEGAARVLLCRSTGKHPNIKRCEPYLKLSDAANCEAGGQLICVANITADNELVLKLMK